jgi:hypothetical protein
MITDNVTPTQFIQMATERLLALQRALKGVEEFQTYLAGISSADLQATGTSGLSLSEAYANGVKSAFADADAVRQFWETGLPPGTYPQPPSAYVYQASAAPIIGPGTPRTNLF